jgi:DNA primase
MEDTAKYLIHADFVADGVVERTDVVGAAFGQTEGLLGEDLDIHDLQDSAKLGRIDVSVDSEGGQSFGTITIASSLDRVETATLAAALEAVERIGPCRAEVEIRRIEDVRAHKRRRIVDRAQELLANAFDEGDIGSEDILREVRESVRTDDITDYEGYPAGPNVESSDAVIVVEGRADVLTLLQYGIKNAVAVEGTDVPDAVADLTEDRTVTAFLDGDRGGDMIRRELGQVGDVDYVARAPLGESVEDLSRDAVDHALRNKTPASAATPIEANAGSADEESPESQGESAESAAGSGTAESAAENGAAASADASAADGSATEDAEDGTAAEATAATDGSATPAPVTGTTNAETGGGTATAGAATESDATQRTEPAAKTLANHVEEVVDSGTVRLLDEELAVLAEADAADAFDELEAAAAVPRVVVLDGAVTQRLLDLAAQRGVGTVVGTETGEFVKQPASVRVHTADDY